MNLRLRLWALTACAACLLFLSFAPGVGATEQRCNELGANCVCSEPLNTATYAQSGAAFKAADSTSKSCTYKGNPAGYAVAVAQNQRVYGSNDPAILGKLPAGNRVSYVQRMTSEDPATGNVDWFVGHYDNSNTYVKRYAWRFYRFVSSDFQMMGDGSCQNNKLTFTEYICVDPGWGNSRIQTYQWLNFTGGTDCCWYGPSPTANGGPSFWPNGTSSWAGRWWYHEFVITNRAGGSSPNGYRIEGWARDVTNNGPLLKVLDSSASGANVGEGGGGTWTPKDGLTPAVMGDTKQGLDNRFEAVLYRQGTCNGHYAISHFMVAGWDSDQGQRIGPAYEIEGGGRTDTTPPNPPLNLVAH